MQRTAFGTIPAPTTDDRRCFVQLMKTIPWSWVLVLSIAVFDGCGRKPTASSELEKAASALAAAEPEPAPQAAPSASEPAAQEPSPIAAPALGGSAADPTPSPARQMQQALASYKGGELEDAVTRLQKLRMQPTLTAQQRMAVQDSVAAVMSEVYSLAEKGDQRAVQAVKQYEEMQTSRH